jgi:hypothetical protein
MPAKGKEIVDIEVVVEAETDKAWLVVSANTGRKSWVPKSQGELDGTELTLPRWMAEDKELI